MIMRGALGSGLAVLAAACLAGPLAAQEPDGPDVEFRQVPAIFVPAMAGSGEEVFEEIGIVLLFPLLWPSSTRISEDVTLSFRGQQTVIKAGTLLPRVMVRKVGETDVWRQPFCVRSRNKARNEGLPILLQQLNDLTKSLRDGQLCLEDSDADGQLDRALALGYGDKVIELGEIPAQRFEEKRGAFIGEGDVAFLSLTTVRENWVELELKILIDDAWVDQFDSMRTGDITLNRKNVFAVGEKSAYSPFAGIEIELLETNRRDNSARIRWQQVSDEVTAYPMPEKRKL